MTSLRQFCHSLFLHWQPPVKDWVTTRQRCWVRDLAARKAKSNSTYPFQPSPVEKLRHPQICLTPRWDNRGTGKVTVPHSIWTGDCSTISRSGLSHLMPQLACAAAYACLLGYGLQLADMWHTNVIVAQAQCNELFKKVFFFLSVSKHMHYVFFSHRTLSL